LGKGCSLIKLASKRRNFLAVHGAQQKIHEGVSSWPRWISGAGLIDLMEKFIQRGLTAPPHRFGPDFPLILLK
jgi:hypothetical protein